MTKNIRRKEISDDVIPIKDLLDEIVEKIKMIL